MKEQRQSNIEVLRILCMFLIVLGHSFVFYERAIGDYPLKWFNLNVFFPIIIIHVNVFVLISGYFGLSIKLNKIMNLWLLCFFYSLLAFCVVIFHSNISVQVWKSLLFPLTYNWWFMRVYFMLLILSPALNIVVKYADEQSQWTRLLLIAFLFNFYFSWFHRLEGLYAMGYDICNFCCLYLLGRYIAYHRIILSTRFLLLLFFFFQIIKIICFKYCSLFPALKHFLDVSCYNNPLNVFSAVIILILFIRWRIGWRNAMVNKIASSCISVYLITELPVVRNALSILLRNLYDNMVDKVLYSFLKILLLLSIFILCIVIDKIRLWLFKKLSLI